MDLLLKARAGKEGGKTEWDDDSSSVLQKFPPQLRNRIESILSQKQTPVENNAGGNKTREKAKSKSDKPQAFSFEDRAARERDSKKKTPVVTTQKAPVEPKVPVLSDAVQLSPRSKHEHVTR